MKNMVKQSPVKEDCTIRVRRTEKTDLHSSEEQNAQREVPSREEAKLKAL